MHSSQNPTSKQILVVDDEPDVLEFLQIYLESLGWSVQIAHSTNEAFTAISQTGFFLVITDIAMPDMDGYEFISKLKELNVLAQCVVMTGFGYNPNHTLVRINRAMQYACLFKPFNRKKVAEVVQQSWEAYNSPQTIAEPILPPHQ